MDVEQPDDQAIWEGIRQEMNDDRSTSFNFWRMAAIILLLLGLGYVLWNSTIKQGSEKEVIILLKENSSEFAVREAVYTEQIEDKWNKIESYEYDISDYPWINKELKLLDDIREEYINDLETLGMRPEIVSALLRYYENKIRILDQFINDLEKTKMNKNRRTYHEHHI